jgi:glycosyltransferase involved in cell wall biosynthesis
MAIPRLSICIPAYRAERYLPATLEAVRAQTFTDWEVILVEDGSHDAAEAQFKAFAAGGPQATRFVRHERNQGLPATRNTAAALARGEWLVLLDSDDLWTPDHLAALFRTAAAQPDAELVHAGSVLFDSDSGRELEVRAPSAAVRAAFPLSLFHGDYIIQPSSVMLKQALCARVGGFNPAFRYVEDREMWLRCARAGARFAFTGENTCRYRKHATALSTHSAAMAEASAAVFDQHLDWESIPGADRRRRAAGEWAAAGRLRRRSDPALAARHFQHACRIQWRPAWCLAALACRAYALCKTT